MLFPDSIMPFAYDSCVAGATAVYIISFDVTLWRHGPQRHGVASCLHYFSSHQSLSFNHSRYLQSTRCVSINFLPKSTLRQPGSALKSTHVRTGSSCSTIQRSGSSKRPPRTVSRSIQISVASTAITLFSQLWVIVYAQYMTD